MRDFEAKSIFVIFSLVSSEIETRAELKTRNTKLLIFLFSNKKNKKFSFSEFPWKKNSYFVLLVARLLKKKNKRNTNQVFLNLIQFCVLQRNENNWKIRYILETVLLSKQKLLSVHSKQQKILKILFLNIFYSVHIWKKKEKKKKLSETRAKLHNVIEAKRKKKDFLPSNLIGGDLLTWITRKFVA